ncbi:MAG: DUF2892 domain-containing protein [Chitinophagales bacterium]|nr:DUF2892 domain-containing protein [Chitinophagales bacterium]
MKHNMGKTDKMIRTAIALIIAVLYFVGVIKGTLAIVLLIVATVLLLTNFISFCPLYTVLGINTNKEDKA